MLDNYSDQPWIASSFFLAKTASYTGRTTKTLVLVVFANDSEAIHVVLLCEEWSDSGVTWPACAGRQSRDDDVDCFVVTRKDGRKVWIASRARKDGSRLCERGVAIHVVSS